MKRWEKLLNCHFRFDIQNGCIPIVWWISTVLANWWANCGSHKTAIVIFTDMLDTKPWQRLSGYCASFYTKQGSLEQTLWLMVTAFNKNEYHCNYQIDITLNKLLQNVGKCIFLFVQEAITHGYMTNRVGITWKSDPLYRLPTKGFMLIMNIN